MFKQPPNVYRNFAFITFLIPSWFHPTSSDRYRNSPHRLYNFKQPRNYKYIICTFFIGTLSLGPIVRSIKEEIEKDSMSPAQWSFPSSISSRLMNVKTRLGSDTYLPRKSPPSVQYSYYLFELLKDAYDTHTSLSSSRQKWLSIIFCTSLVRWNTLW